MAKRRRLVVPDKSELDKIDESFAAKPPLGQSVTPPIAQVAAESASLSGMAAIGDRVAMARDTADAERWRTLDGSGMGVQLVALEEIDAEYLRRDRLIEDEDAQAELINSIRSHGLRSPIELVETATGFGLISGQRRLRAFQMLLATDQSFLRIPAFVRSHETSASAYVSMIEENEVRANLTHYERGRIAVLAAQQGVFASVEAAVDVLFETASKSKRSKIRSFATVHEAFGDLLRFPTEISERLGLRVAAAIRNGGQEAIRQGLDRADATSASAEAKVLEAGIVTSPRVEAPAKGGRPTEVEHLPIRLLQGGGTLSARVSKQRLVLELRGLDVDVTSAEDVLNALQEYLN